MFIEVMFFFIFVLFVSLVVFASLATLVGTFFNIATAPDSVLASLIVKIPIIAKLCRSKHNH